MWRYCIVGLLTMVGCHVTLAQNVVFVAQAATDKIGTEDRMEIVYTIQNAGDLQTLNPPATLTKDFIIVQGPISSTFSNYSNVNGKVTSSQGINVTYVIQPRKTGNFILGPAVAKDAAGHTYQSNQLNIQVIQGTVMQQRRQQQSQDPFADFFDDPFTAMQRRRQQQLQALRQQQAQPQPAEDAKVNLDKDLFIRVTVDKDKVRIGEQITATYKLYARIPMNCAISKLPSLNGFWTQDFELPKDGNMKPTEEILDGKKYQVFTLKKSALFPQQTGTLELDPAEAEGVARVVQQVRRTQNPFDDPFFQNAFGSLFMDDPFFNQDFFGGMAYKDVKVHLKSKPVKITVTSLPEDGKPADFTGAVGNFTIASSIDKTNLTTDDVANLKLTITGSGNLKLIDAPKLNLPNGLTYLDPVMVDTITSRTTTISGSKIITYPITPNTAGEYTIPPTSFTFYNTQTGKYITLNTTAIKLNVKQGKSNGSNNAIAVGDIHGINTKPINNNISFNSKPLLFTVGYWSLYATPLLAFMGIAFWRRREEELSKDTVLLKNRRANKVALKRLATAQTYLANKQEKAFYEEISKAVWLYLSDKLNIPLSALSHEMANEAMSRKNVPAELMACTQRIVTDCETALYAGYSGTQQMNNTYNEAIDIISKLEDCFKK